MFENNQMTDFMNIRAMRAELFHANGRTDRHHEYNSRFSQLRQRAYSVTFIAVTKI
jgi:hypothetical protein